MDSESERDKEKQRERDRGRERKREGLGMRVRERTCRHELLLAAIMAVFYYNASNYTCVIIIAKFVQNMCFIYVCTNHYHIYIWSVAHVSCAIAESFQQILESINWTKKAIIRVWQVNCMLWVCWGFVITLAYSELSH